MNHKKNSKIILDPWNNNNNLFKEKINNNLNKIIGLLVQ